MSGLVSSLKITRITSLRYFFSRASKAPSSQFATLRASGLLGLENLIWETVQGLVGIGCLWKHGPQVGDVWNSFLTKVQEVVSDENLVGKTLLQVPFIIRVFPEVGDWDFVGCLCIWGVSEIVKTTSLQNIIKILFYILVDFEQIHIIVIILFSNCTHQIIRDSLNTFLSFIQITFIKSVSDNLMLDMPLRIFYWWHLYRW